MQQLGVDMGQGTLDRTITLSQEPNHKGKYSLAERISPLCTVCPSSFHSSPSLGPQGVRQGVYSHFHFVEKYPKRLWKRGFTFLVGFGVVEL